MEFSQFPKDKPKKPYLHEGFSSITYLLFHYPTKQLPESEQRMLIYRELGWCHRQGKENCHAATHCTRSGHTVLEIRI